MKIQPGDSRGQTKIICKKWNAERATHTDNSTGIMLAMNTEYPRSPSNRTAAFRLNNCSDGLLKNCVAYGYDDFAHISNCKNMRAIDCTHIPATNSSPAEDDLSEVRREPSENTNRGRSSTTFSFPPQKKELQQGLPKIIALAISRLSVNPAFAEPCFPQYSDSTQS